MRLSLYNILVLLVSPLIALNGNQSPSIKDKEGWSFYFWL